MADTKLSALTELAATPADNDEVYIRDVSEAASAESKRITVANLIAGAGGGADFPMKLKPALVRWVIPGWSFVSQLNQGVGAGLIYYIPIFVTETTTYIRIGIEVATAVSGSADLRIFNWSSGLPGTLVLSAGTIDTGSTGKKEITISQELTRGYYFLAIRCTNNPTLKGVNPAGYVTTPLSGFAINMSAPLRIILLVDAAYADPAPTPTGSIWVEFASIYLREN